MHCLEWHISWLYKQFLRSSQNGSKKFLILTQLILMLKHFWFSWPFNLLMQLDTVWREVSSNIRASCGWGRTLLCKLRSLQPFTHHLLVYILGCMPHTNESNNISLGKGSNSRWNPLCSSVRYARKQNMSTTILLVSCKPSLFLLERGKNCPWTL